MAEANVLLTPTQELAPGQVSAIRNATIEAVVNKASRELGLPKDRLVVRDIRAYDDLGFGRNTDYSATAIISNIWGSYQSSTTTYSVSGTVSTAGVYRDAIPDSTAMGDNRFVGIYGVRDSRVSRATIKAQEVSLLKFTIGAADRTIWDLTECAAYKNYVAGVTPSPIVIPPLAPYQISAHLIGGGEELGVQLMGFVVEPAGLTITPVSDKIGTFAQTHTIPVMELAPGSVSAIRNGVIAGLLKQASEQLRLPEDKLVVRDIRPYADLAWFSNDAVSNVFTEITNERWDTTIDATVGFCDASTDFFDIIDADHVSMADERFVAIWGVKDARACLSTVVEPRITLIKFTVGGNDRAIWDIQGKDAYPNAMAAVSPSAIVIPQNTDYQIAIQPAFNGNTSADDVVAYLTLEGVVIEPMGKLLSP